MKKAILIIGIGGVGKSTLCKYLKRNGHEAYDLERVKDLFCMRYANTGEIAHDYDCNNLEKVRRAFYVCDSERLQKLIKSQKNTLAFYCGSGLGSNIGEMTHLFNEVLLLKVKNEILRMRLSTRDSIIYGGAPDVRDYILQQKNSWEKGIEKKGVITVCAEGGIEEVAEIVLKLVA